VKQEDPAGLQGNLRKQVLPVTVAGVFLMFAVFLFKKMPPALTPDSIVTWVFLLVVIPVLLCWFPAGVILYGWSSGNPARAVLAGLLLFPLYFVAGFFMDLVHNEGFLPHAATIYFIAVLSAACGIAGYCASRRSQEYLAVSVILTGLGLVFLLDGIT